MKKILFFALMAGFSFQAQAQLNNATIEEVQRNIENVAEYVEQDMNLLKEHVDHVSQDRLLEARRLMKMKYEKLTSPDITKEAIGKFSHSLNERLHALIGDEFQKLADDERVIRQLNGLSLFVNKK